MWFNRNFSACLQRGYDELFKAELFLSKIKSKAVILYKYFSSWRWLLFFLLSRKAQLGSGVCLSAMAIMSVCVYAFEHKKEGRQYGF